MTNFQGLIECLTESEVKFIIVGGFAAAIHGASRSTQDLDIVYQQSPENIDRLIRALSPLSPYPRGAIAGIPFNWDKRTIEFGANFTLATKLGYIEVFGDITGGGAYGRLLPHTIYVLIFGR